MYMDLRYEDAIGILQAFNGLPPLEKASPCERELAQRRDGLMAELDRLPTEPNPLLLSVERILVEHYSSKPNSKAIIFVRTKKHASCVCDWVSSLPKYLNIKPQEVTGHTRETGPGMTQSEQELALKSFHKGTCNLLVSTSVAEEGLDVPACNVVIRFQHVSNEIAKVQTRGRARAAGSVGYTILSSDTQKTIQEIKNGELESLVEEIRMSGENSPFPQGKLLKMEIMKEQKQLMRDREFQRMLAAQRGQKENKTQAAHTFQLKCKKCKVLTCNGNDVYTLENAKQFVVPDEQFRTSKISIKPRHSPKRITETMAVTDKIHCAGCDAEWGNMTCVHGLLLGTHFQS